MKLGKVFLPMGFLGVFLAGCGVSTPSAQRANVQAVPLRVFPKQDWRLVNNKFFLWRDPMTAHQASRAMAISRDLDNLDGKALPLNRRHFDLDQQLQLPQAKQKQVADHLRALKKSMDATSKLLSAAKKKSEGLAQQVKQEQTKPHPDTGLVDSLNKQILQLSGEIQARTSDLASQTQVKTQFDREATELSKAVKPLQDEEDQIEAQQANIESQGSQKVSDIMQVVDWYKDQPGSVVFQFNKDGSLSASISGWNLNDDAGDRNFSTRSIGGKKPTMANVTYTELGGTFEFDVYVYLDDAQTELRERYHFKISRTNYDYPDGRVFYIGDITRTSSQNGQLLVRHGMAKLVDRNN